MEWLADLWAKYPAAMIGAIATLVAATVAGLIALYISRRSRPDSASTHNQN